MVGEQFSFNCYKHYVQTLIHWPGHPPVILIIRWGFSQGDVVLYRTNLIPLVDEFWVEDPDILSPFYADGASFGGLE